MFQITCPWCGPRSEDEFAYGGEIPADGTAWDAPLDQDALAASLFMRDNVRGPHNEYWLHSGGCRQWLRVRRSTANHEVISVAVSSAGST